MAKTQEKMKAEKPTAPTVMPLSEQDVALVQNTQDRELELLQEAGRHLLAFLGAGNSLAEHHEALIKERNTIVKTIQQRMGVPDQGWVLDLQTMTFMTNEELQRRQRQKK